LLLKAYRQLSSEAQEALLGLSKVMAKNLEKKINKPPIGGLFTFRNRVYTL